MRKDKSIPYGKLPPQAPEIEEAILSIIINNSDNSEIIPTINKYLRKDVFYKISHQHIFEALIELYNSDKPYDMLMVVEHLRYKNTIDEAGGPYAVALICQQSNSIGSLEHYCAYIFELFLRREIITLLSNKIEDAYNLSVDIVDIYNELHTHLESLFGFLDDDMVHRISVSVDRALEEMQSIKSGTVESIVKCGYRLLDEVGYTSVYDIINFSSARSAGKTRFLISVIKGFLERNKNIAVQWWSMEDSDTKIVRAFASADTQLSDQQMLGKNHKLTDDELISIRKAM
jgi:replicative DNA helicase